MTELEARLEAVERKMWYIEMADYIRGSERIEYERLKAERYRLLDEISKAEKKN